MSLWSSAWCVFTGFREKTCDVTQKLVLLCHCGRISNAGRELTPAIPLLSCVFLNLSRLSVWLRLLRHDLTSALTDILLRGASVTSRSPRAVCCRFLTVRQQEQTVAQPPSSPYRGYTSLFVLLQAARLHCKHRCCIIHSRSEAAVPGDWQVMGQQDAAEPRRRLEGKSFMTRRFQPFP